MKKNAIVAALLLLSVNMAAQAFEKGNMNLDVRFGLGVYGTQQTTTTNLSYTFLGNDFNQSEKNDTTDGTASKIFQLNFEYGLSNRIGLGVGLTSLNYFIEEKDKEFTKSIKGLDFGLQINFHLLKANRNDLFVSFGFGGSKIN